MGLLWSFAQQVRTWERASQLSLVLALIVLFALGSLILTQDDPLRTASAIGFVATFVVLQMIVLWGNRRMVTHYTMAQRAFLAGDMNAAHEHLLQHIDERSADGKTADSDTLTLLGNVYRNLGEAEQSLKVLRQAVEKAPASHFPRYGLGRTLLVMGDYAGAKEQFSQAIAAGGPQLIVFELGLTLYLMGDTEAALSYLRQVDMTYERYRQLLAQILVYHTDGATLPDAELVDAGIVYWSAQVERWGHTDYGQRIHQILQTIDS